MKTRVLFVDDESNVLSGLRRMLRTQRKEWEMGFANGGQEALQLMDENPYDVVVSDMRMPGIDGAELLSQVAATYPQSVRLILSGQSEHEKILRAVGPAHQFISKPCDPDVLIKTIQSACALQDQLHDEALASVVSRIDCLPSLPRIYRDLVNELELDDSSLDRVADIVGSDIGMTAKILQLVNSSFFGLPQHVTSPKHAVSLLGLNVIRPLALTANTFLQYDDPKIDGFSLEESVSHSLAVATRSRALAGKLSNDTHSIDDAYIAGMMHDIGKLILAINFESQFNEAVAFAERESVPLWEAETAVFGTSHAQIGAHLLGLWGLPNPVVEAVAYHHQPDAVDQAGLTPLTAVHVANVLLQSQYPGDQVSTKLGCDENYLTRLGLCDQVQEWNQEFQQESLA